MKCIEQMVEQLFANMARTHSTSIVRNSDIIRNTVVKLYNVLCIINRQALLSELKFDLSVNVSQHNYQIKLELSFKDDRQQLITKHFEFNQPSSLSTETKAFFDWISNQLEEKNLIFWQTIQCLKTDVNLFKKNKARRKSPQKIQTGEVSSIVKEHNYGTLSTASEQRIYFHRSSFKQDTYQQLVIGSRLNFILAFGPLGPQALQLECVES